MALRHNRTLSVVALGGALTLTLAGCGGDSDDDTASGGSSPTSAASVSAECAEFAQYGDLKGKTVSVYTGIVTPEDALLKKTWAPFEKCTGATIKGEFDKTF